MYVIVIGLGQVGRHVIRTLEQEHHDIVAIDMDPKAVAYVEEHHDVATITGYGADWAVLRSARCSEADLVVSATDNDEINLLSAIAAREHGAKRTIARVQRRVWGQGDAGVYYGLLGIDAVINPQVLIAQEIAKITRSHGAIEVLDLANDRVELAQVAIEDWSRMTHKPIAELKIPRGVLVAAVVRAGEVRVPGGADVLLPGDRVYLIGRREEMEAAEDLFTSKRAARRVCIIGGGVVGEALTRSLLRDGAHVLVIESDRERAEYIAAEMAGATVVHGDGTDLDLLQEEEVQRFDLVAALTHDDEVNLMASLIAKRAGALRTLCLVRRPDYTDIYRQLGIDIVLSPRVVASDHILRYVRTSDLQSLTLLEDGQAEVIEFVAQPGSRVVGVPVRRMNMPPGSLLCAILHKDEVIIPRGDDFIRVGDTVVVLTLADTRAAVARLFRAKSV